MSSGWVDIVLDTDIVMARARRGHGAHAAWKCAELHETTRTHTCTHEHASVRGVASCPHKHARTCTLAIADGPLYCGGGTRGEGGFWLLFGVMLRTVLTGTRAHLRARAETQAAMHAHTSKKAAKAPAGARTSRH